MATLYVKTPNGTQYSIDLTKVNSSGGSANTNGYALMDVRYNGVQRLVETRL